LPQGRCDSLVAVIGWSLPSQDGTYQVVMNGIYNSGESLGTQFIDFDVSSEAELNTSSTNQFKARFRIRDLLKLFIFNLCRTPVLNFKIARYSFNP
jgi:hypothetical protein